jgi:DNA replication ATP-dependent helicase Dna2
MVVDVNTIDRCQGRDWEVIVLSLVRSNDAKLTGEILTDWRRLNVAVSRAKKKLVVIGDIMTLSGVPILYEMIKLMKKNNWVQQLPRDWQK